VTGDPGGLTLHLEKVLKARHGEVFHLRGEFREIDPPRRLAYTFEWEERALERLSVDRPPHLHETASAELD
jgi:uncharacterized protein YndB with AHSA1/START domain